ncbi:hypothetical protein BV22DRAFT_1132507 [Leucogyrophana mollusca]|uniref:Uncharacterized protein n=1 Tax=Leucogyrophana mollusca TaxID=85980 RepID=A0ACB8B7C8_9AGAM|nr:hypothetical protein BV22DRAFT_1132507 [Leucogyrophana mollusca]
MFSARRAPQRAAPAPAPPRPPPPPVETPSAKVRKEWQRFISTWYEPEKKKLEDELQKELNAKFKNAKSKIQRKARDTEKEKREAEIVEGLAVPARTEWEQRLAAAQVEEEAWVDITLEEQQFVQNVFKGLFRDEDEEDEDGEDADADATSPFPDDEDEATESMFADVLSIATAKLSPPTPITGTFEFVSPSSFSADNTSPPNPTKILPALPMDLASLTAAMNGGRHNHAPPPPVGHSTSGGLGFETWAAEASLFANPQKNPGEPSSSRLAPPDKMSRQTSTASTIPSPSIPRPNVPPQGSPPRSAFKQSPPTMTDTLRYIGPDLTEEDTERAEKDFLQFKLDVRIQMISEFHEEAVLVEIELVQKLSSPDITSDSRRRELQEHQQKMLQLRELKELKRKKLCADERAKRRGEYNRRTPAEVQIAANRLAASREQAEALFAPPPAKTAQIKQPEKPIPPKASASRWITKAENQKDAIPTMNFSNASTSNLEIPGILKKTNSNRSQDEPSPSPVMVEMPPPIASASLAKAKGTWNMSSVADLPNLLKKNDSTRSWGEPAIEPPVAAEPPPAPAPAPAPPATTITTGKGKKGKKGQAAKQAPQVATPAPPPPPPEIKVEPPPPAPAQKAPAWGSVGSSSTKGTLSPAAAKQTGKKGAKQTEPPRRVPEAAPISRSVTVEEVEDVDDDWSSIAVSALKAMATPTPEAEVEVEEEQEEEDAPGENSWYNHRGDSSYWGNITEGRPVGQMDEETVKPTKHVRWTPNVDFDDAASDEGEPDPVEEDLARDTWFQWAVSGGGAEVEEPAAPAAKLQAASTTTSIWEQGKGKTPPAVGKGKSKGGAQAASASGDKNGPQGGQWPSSMESWLTSASRMAGQSSGSARFF